MSPLPLPLSLQQALAVSQGEPPPRLAPPGRVSVKEVVLVLDAPLLLQWVGTATARRTGRTLGRLPGAWWLARTARAVMALGRRARAWS